MSTHFKVLVALWIVTASPLATAEGEQWQSRAEGSELNFSAWYEGEEIPGAFARFAVSLAIDTSGGEPTALSVEVETNSADMNDGEINQELAEPDWFDSVAFPAAHFTSDDIAQSADGYVASGRLRIKDVEQPLRVPFTWQPEGSRAALAGSVDLSRLDWRVGGGEWASNASLADRVRVTFKVSMVRSE